MDSVVGMSWDSKGENLLIRMEPINQEAWREIAQIAVDRLRDLAARALFKAKVQMLSVHGAKNLVFALQPIKAENQNQPQ